MVAHIHKIATCSKTPDEMLIDADGSLMRVDHYIARHGITSMPTTTVSTISIYYYHAKVVTILHFERVVLLFLQNKRELQ